MAAKQRRDAPKGSAYDRITARILEHLEKGVVPWHQPWVGGGAPRNLDGRAYRGINALLLASAGFASPHWGTFKAVQAKGGRVKRGQHGTLIFLWRPVTEEEAARRREREVTERAAGGGPTPARRPRQDDSRWIVSSHVVFNLEQCEGIELSAEAQPPARTFTPIEEAERIVEAMTKRPTITEEGGRAYYRPAADSITVPPRARFASESGFYSTLFHELAHSTGAAHRLARPGIHEGFDHFGSDQYGREELVAEMAAAFLRAAAGIENGDAEANSAAYLNHWMEQIRGDKTLVVQAARGAQRAADFILGQREERVEQAA